MITERRNFIGHMFAYLIALGQVSSCRQQISTENISNNQGMTAELDNLISKQFATQLNCSTSGDGGRCAFLRIDTEDNTIAVVDFNLKVHYSFVFKSKACKIEDVIISRDGKRIAFVVIENIGLKINYYLWVINIQGSVELILKGDYRTFAKPAFSPDGMKLAFFADMRHQYLAQDILNKDSQTETASFAVHELDLMSNNIRLVALPILPFVSGCFYGSKESITGIWNAEVEDPEFNNLPAKCVCGLSQIRYRNQWQLYRSRLHQTVGDVNLAINEQGIFKKFDMKMPEFNSIRDYFFLSNSPCENGFLAEVYMFDATNDPSIERLQNPRYASPYAPKIGLSWLSRNGRRDDIKLPANFSGIPHVSGSFDRSRVVVWAGINNEPAAASKYPWTKSLNSEWHPIDLSNIYKKDKLFEINRMNDTLIIELPKLIDPRGIGKTFDEQFLKSSGRN